MAIHAGSTLTALLFIWCLLPPLETAALHLEERTALCFSILETEDSFCIISGAGLKIAIRRYRGAQQIYWTGALFFSAFVQMTRRSLVVNGTRNDWWLYCLTDNELVPCLTNYCWNERKGERCLNSLTASTRAQHSSLKFFGDADKWRELHVWGTGNACAYQGF